MESKLVSVMMPAYNAEKYIGEAVNSLIAQTYTNWELIVVDDGSIDGTAAIVMGFSDPRIKMVQQANGGESVARNTALRHMRGEFVAFLDADDVYLPDHLQMAVDCLQHYPEDGGVYTDGYYCDETSRRLKTLSSQRRGPFEGHIYDEVVRSSDAICPPVCVVLRRQPIVTHKLQFDTDIVIGPDWVFFMQFAEVEKFRYINQCTCLYRIHLNSITYRTAHQKRAAELAKCRITALHTDSFDRCALDVRVTVFYDLLITLLEGDPEQQTRITRWPQFLNLPPEEQARLLRLMASAAIYNGGIGRSYVTEWLHRSRNLSPRSRRGKVLTTAYDINPTICRLFLRMRRWPKPAPDYLTHSQML